MSAIPRLEKAKSPKSDEINTSMSTNYVCKCCTKGSKGKYVLTYEPTTGIMKVLNIDKSKFVKQTGCCKVCGCSGSNG